MTRGDVVLLVASGDLGKPRPGVIVQADELGDVTTSVLICPMSSDLSEFRRTRPIVEPSPENGLRVRSQIMTDKLSALRRDRYTGRDDAGAARYCAACRTRPCTLSLSRFRMAGLRASAAHRVASRGRPAHQAHRNDIPSASCYRLLGNPAR